MVCYMVLERDVQQLQVDGLNISNLARTSIARQTS